MVLGRSSALPIYQAVGIAASCGCETPGARVIFEGALFYLMAVSFDLYRFTMMDKAINGGRSEVVVQDVAPISDGLVVTTMVPHS